MYIIFNGDVFIEFEGLRLTADLSNEPKGYYVTQFFSICTDQIKY